jgi:nicotinate-nucleotide pyrophosphorylase (carboxylating)
MRIMEKEAVKIGGGHNHRMGLFDRFLIKDNHIKAYGNIKRAIESIKKRSLNKLIEVEVRNFNELNEALLNPPDIIMLDNMNPIEVKKAVKIINKKCKVEVSGGINLNNILAYAKCGVDYISIGELTHSIKSCDVSMKIVNDE